MEDSCDNDKRSDESLDLDRDRISSLPDHLLLHIMSFLNTKEAVVTGILSSRWKGLWSSSQNISLCDNRCRADVHPNNGNGLNFIKFVERFLSLHVAPKISNLSLCWSYDEENSEDSDSVLDSLIDFAILKGAEEIDLILHAEFGECAYELPPVLYQCDRLVSLSLRCCEIELPSSPVCFRSLVVLYLLRIISDCEIIQAVLDGCPLLEVLEISECEGSGHLHISSSPPSNLPLKRLTIDQYRGICGEDPHPSFEICAPNLQFLKLIGYNCDISLKGLSSLSKVFLDLWLNFEQLPILEQLLRDLSHVKDLQLSNRCIQVMSLATLQDLHSYIPKAKCLLLQTEALRCEVRGIANLLWSSRNIETLIIMFTPPVIDFFDETIDHEGSNYWDALNLSFPCLVQNLKTIKITGFMVHRNFMHGSDMVRSFAENLPSQLTLVRFLLKSAAVLEKMSVDFSSRPAFVTVEAWLKMKSMAIETLKGISRASARAELLFLP